MDFINNLKEYLLSTKRKDQIRNTKHTGRISEDTFNPEKVFGFEDMSIVKKPAGENLRILNLSDVHFTDYRDIMHTAPKRSIPTPLTVYRLIKKVKPHIITVTGDIVCGKSTVYSINNFTALMEHFSIPWAPIFGNHDKEGNCDLNYLADVMMSAPHCLMKKGDPKMGVGNYTVGITDEKGKLINALLMTDSSLHYNADNAPDTVKKQWVKWVCSGVKALSENAQISVFMHVPLPEYIDAYELHFNKNTKSWIDKKLCIGHLGEEIACHRDKVGTPVNTGLFQILKNEKNVKNIFCGHDHLNAFSLPYEGIRLNYVMKISKSAGRKPGYDGGLQITFKGDGKTELDYKTVSYGPIISAYKITY